MNLLQEMDTTEGLAENDDCDAKIRYPLFFLLQEMDMTEKDMAQVWSRPK